jgi:HK97 family phage major capsid protein
MTITALLKKLAKGETLTSAEKDFLLANKDVLNEDQLKAVESAKVEDPEGDDEDEVEEDEEMDEKSLEALLTEKLEKKVDEIANRIANKFVNGVAASRKRAIDTGVSQASEKDEKVRGFMKALFTNDHSSLKDISGLSSGAGGYLIPPELVAEVIRIAEKQYGLARRDFRYLPFTGPGNSRTIPALASGVSVYWTNEAAAKTSTGATFSLVTQTLKKLAAIVPMTEEIIEDSSINLTALVAELFAEAVSKEEDLQFFNGTGSPWTGILNNGSVNVVRIDTTDPTDVVADDLLDMIDATPTGALAGSKFYMSRSVYSVIRKLKEDGSGAYIVSPPTADGPASIWGYPIEVSDAFPATSVTGTSKPFVLFGNLGVCAIFGDKQQLRVKMLDQATVRNTADDADLNLAQQDMVAVRIVERVGYVLALPTGVTVLKTSAS